MSEIRVTSVVGENGGERVGLTTGLTVGPLTGTTGIGATISHQGHAQFTGVCTASSFVGNGVGLTGLTAGITEFDHYDLTVDQSANAVITNWARPNNTASAGFIGTGMSVSSGIFTFPRTGKYLVMANMLANITGGNDNILMMIDVTVDGGSSYTTYGRAFDGNPSGSKAGSGIGLVFLDITDVSQRKVRFRAQSIASPGYIMRNDSGDNNHSLTTVTFVRIGDT